MPLLVTAVPVVVPPPPPGPVTPPAPPPRSILTWIAPDGTELPLTTARDSHLFGWFALDDVGGLWGAAPVSHVRDPHPRGGTRRRHTRFEQRTITLPLFMRGRDHVEFVAMWQRLSRLFTMTSWRGPARLRVARPDGGLREVFAEYDDGFDGQPAQGYTFDTVVLSLYCDDPYWRDVTPTTVVREFVVGAPYLNPYPRVSPAGVLGRSQIVNAGDVRTWPQWTISGPASALVAANQTNRQSFTLTHNLPAGQRITLTTDPPTVRGPAGEVLTDAIDWPGARLWPLEPGVNQVDFQATGSGPGTKVELSYVQLWETP